MLELKNNAPSALLYRIMNTKFESWVSYAEILSVDICLCTTRGRSARETNVDAMAVAWHWVLPPANVQYAFILAILFSEVKYYTIIFYKNMSLKFGGKLRTRLSLKSGKILFFGKQCRGFPLTNGHENYFPCWSVIIDSLNTFFFNFRKLVAPSKTRHYANIIYL